MIADLRQYTVPPRGPDLDAMSTLRWPNLLSASHGSSRAARMPPEGLWRIASSTKTGSDAHGDARTRPQTSYQCIYCFEIFCGYSAGLLCHVYICSVPGAFRRPAMCSSCGARGATNKTETCSCTCKNRSVGHSPGMVGSDWLQPARQHARVDLPFLRVRVRVSEEDEVLAAVGDGARTLQVADPTCSTKLCTDGKK